jgi:hypothetical protein
MNKKNEALLMASPKMSAKELWWPIVMAHIA